mmetsp:Transcript_37818/g.74398  ORF Transcript_37818/g.74398 Transcript_37818/m.74398 type:complete len:207 (-) Transcript_37818:222-842(-)
MTAASTAACAFSASSSCRSSIGFAKNSSKSVTRRVGSCSFLCFNTLKERSSAANMFTRMSIRQYALFCIRTPSSSKTCLCNSLSFWSIVWQLRLLRERWDCILLSLTSTSVCFVVTSEWVVEMSLWVVRSLNKISVFTSARSLQRYDLHAKKNSRMYSILPRRSQGLTCKMKKLLWFFNRRAIQRHRPKYALSMILMRGPAASLRS